MRRSLYPKQDPPPGGWALALHRKSQYVGVYKSFYDFASRYYGIDNLLAGSQVNPVPYTAVYIECCWHKSES